MSSTCMPCPWCGSEPNHTAHEAGRHDIACTGPYMGECPVYPLVVGKATEAEAVAAWNAQPDHNQTCRALDAAKARIDALEEALTLLADEHEDQAHAWAHGDDDIDQSEYHAAMAKIARDALGGKP